MVEIIVMEHLREALALPAYGEVPAEKPERFLVVEKTGGSERDLVERAMIAIQSYAPTLAEAAALNADAIGAMRALPGTRGVSAARRNADYNFTDPASKDYRYQAVYEIYYQED